MCSKYVSKLCVFKKVIHLISNWVRLAIARGQRFISDEIKSQSENIISPNQYALSFAIGTLISFIPLPVIDTLLASFILLKSKQINKLAFLAARVVWNDLIVYPLYVPSFKLGSSAVTSLGGIPTSFFMETDLIVWIASFSMGMIILAVLATAASYGLAITAFTVFWPIVKNIKIKLPTPGQIHIFHKAFRRQPFAGEIRP